MSAKEAFLTAYKHKKNKLSNLQGFAIHVKKHKISERYFPFTIVLKSILTLSIIEISYVFLYDI